MNRKYDIGFIVNPETPEDELKKIIESVVALIEKADGKVESLDEWGRRKLAFPIEKHNEGIYVFIIAEMKGSGFFELERRLKYHEKVMRFVILRLDDKLKKANRLNKKWKRMEKMSKKNQPDSREKRERREPRDVKEAGSNTKSEAREVKNAE